MPFSQQHFILHRPYLYHFTLPTNLDLLQRLGEMASAAEWVRRANAYRTQIHDPRAFLSSPRTATHELQVGPGQAITLNDQKPLARRSSFGGRLRGTRAAYVRRLNSLVFFWPGTEQGPRPKNQLSKGFSLRYPDYAQVRVSTADVWTANSRIRFCTCNSGAPQARDGLVRGLTIFRRLSHPDLELRKVAEVVFEDRLLLPQSTQVRLPHEQSWELLFPNPVANRVITSVSHP